MRNITLAAALGLAAVPTQAAVLMPSATAVVIDSFDAATRGTQLAFSSVSGTSVSFSATVYTAVYRNTAGTLDFYIQGVRTGAGSFDDLTIQRLELALFGSADVFAFVDLTDFDGAGNFLAVNNPGGGVGTAFRSANGNTVGVDLGGTPSNLSGTENSAVYIFRTNATQFVAGTFTISGRSSLSGTAFAPVAAIPEPATWSIMLLGFGLCGLAMRFRRRSSGAATA